MGSPNQDVQSVLRSQEYFRLKKTLQSSGDIFELDTSAKAIYIGPDSDIGEVQLTYFNPDEPLSLETAQVSVNGPFVGRIDSNVVQKVSSTGQLARILVSPADLINQTYVIPPLFGNVAQRQFNIPTVLDLIVSLRDPPDVPAVRADRTLRFPRVPYTAKSEAPMGTNGSTYLVVPIYGRRMVTVTVAGNIDLTALLYLVTLQPGGGNTVPRSLGQFTIASSTTPTDDYFSKTAVIRASDAARIGFFLSDASPPVVTSLYAESDQPNDPTDTGADAQEPVARGMSDLLVVQLISTLDATAGSPLFADVFVKVADKET